MPEWFDKFFDGLYAKVLSNQFDNSQTLKQIRTVKRLLKLRKGAKVLDIPCGMGRLTIPMARMGMVMTGVDLAATYLEKARRLAKRDGLDIRFIHCDMREIAFDKEFDAAFNWWGSFGYFSNEENLDFCRQVYKALKPGGRFLVEGMNKSWLLRHFRAHNDQSIGGVRIIHYTRWDGKSKRVRDTWKLSYKKVTRQRKISMRVFNGAEIRSMLSTAGFRDIRLFGRPALGRFTRHSRRFIAVAKRSIK